MEPGMNRYFIKTLSLIAGLILCAAAMNMGFAQSVNQKDGSAAVPQDLAQLGDDLIKVLNSGKVWEIGPLISPDVEKEKATRDQAERMSYYPYPSATPLPEDSHYKLYGFTKVAEGVWIANYGRFDRKDEESALWVHKGKYWYLKWFGPKAMEQLEAQKYKDQATKKSKK
jgi:hypothetical protein